MIVYAVLFSFITYGLFIYNFVTGIILHVKNLSEFFKVPNTKSDKAWSDDPEYFNIGNMLMFFFVWFITTMMSIMFTPIFVIIYCLISPLSAKYSLAQRDKQKNDKLYSFANFLKDIVTYKETILLVLCIYKLITNTNTYLGNSYSAGIFIALIILIFVFKIFVIPIPTDITEIKIDSLTLPEQLAQPVVTSGSQDSSFCQKTDKIPPEYQKWFSYFGGNQQPNVIASDNKVGGGINSSEIKRLKKIKHFNVKLI
jgi:hypothetical protein